jgi:hypothetical protein
LPVPDGPSITENSPAVSVSETPCQMTWWPKDLVSPSTQVSTPSRFHPSPVEQFRHLLYGEARGVRRGGRTIFADACTGRYGSFGDGVREGVLGAGTESGAAGKAEAGGSDGSAEAADLVRRPGTAVGRPATFGTSGTCGTCGADSSGSGDADTSGRDGTGTGSGRDVPPVGEGVGPQAPGAGGEGVGVPGPEPAGAFPAPKPS